jgi:hypothetical protein
LHQLWLQSRRRRVSFSSNNERASPLLICNMQGLYNYRVLRLRTQIDLAKHPERAQPARRYRDIKAVTRRKQRAAFQAPKAAVRVIATARFVGTSTGTWEKSCSHGMPHTDCQLVRGESFKCNHALRRRQLALYVSVDERTGMLFMANAPYG